MFADFLKKLTAPSPDPLSEGDARLALTAVLVRVARADGRYHREEEARIIKIAQQRYGLNPADADRLRLDAEFLEGEAPDTVRFTKAIKGAVDYEKRTEVVEAMWQVALADGERDAEEDAIVRLVANFLGVSDTDSAYARQRVSKAV